MEGSLKSTNIDLNRYISAKRENQECREEVTNSFALRESIGRAIAQAVTLD